LYGNQEKDRKPIKDFINVIKCYPGLEQILVNIGGLITQRGVHASGVVFAPQEDPYKFGCYMKAKNGAIITQYSLHDQEYCGDTKYDFLVTEVQDVITQCLNLLQKHKKVEENLTLRELYDKYLSPENLPLNDEQL
jgi:DNA polymerase-3 subunit alpha